MDLQDFGRFLRASWAFVVVGAVVGALLGAAFSLTQQPEYRATARVFVGTSSTNDVNTLNGGLTFNQQIVTSYTTVVTDPIVLGPVVQRLHLDTTVDELAQQVTAEVPAGTLVIDITVTDSSAAQSARIANAIGASLTSAVPKLTPSTRVRITTTKQAVAPAGPVSPNYAVDLVLGLMAGLVIGLIVAFLRAATDTRLRSATDVARVVDAPLLGSVATGNRSEQSHLLDGSDIRSARGEAYRLLRTNLQFLDTSAESHSFVVTSPSQGEGKTTTVSNLAVTLATTGRSVVLVDADLRRPRLHRVFGLEGGVGLTDVLIGTVSLEQALQTWGEDGLHVLPAGTVPPNPSELLQSPAMEELLDQLRERFGTILFDSPPVVPVADAAILATRSTGAILVVAENRTRRPDLSQAVDRLAQVHARLLGTVMNFERGNRAPTYGDAPKATRKPVPPTRLVRPAGSTDSPGGIR